MTGHDVSKPWNVDISAARAYFETIYRTYNRPEFIHPDPLEIVLEYPDRRDREIVGLIAASFALGRVGSILATARRVCELLAASGRGMHHAILRSTERDFVRMFDGFVYRFYRSEHLVGLLTGIRALLDRYETLEQAFASHSSFGDATCLSALEGFVTELRTFASFEPTMIPDPARGSGCKRLLLYLRWMVRRDAVDPGPWEEISPASLLVPVDVHMHRICLQLGIIHRRSISIKTSEEITGFFRAINPLDPVRYDFALTRFGIHPKFGYADIPQFRLSRNPA